MISHCHEMLAHQRAAPRWKEWIPLASQQLRLRNLIQVIAYNVNISDKLSSSCDTKTKASQGEKTKTSFYYTLHLTTMSAPFYTSERIESENPKWAEIEIGDTVNGVNASVNGIVVRLWVHRNAEQDQVLTVSGVYFSGLIYLGPKLCSDPTTFCLNTIVFHMQGGYFTAPQSFKESPKKLRYSKVAINAIDVRPSYTVSLVSRLHTIQQAIKKQVTAAQVLREKISVGGYNTSESRESTALRRLLNKTRPQAPQREELLKAQRELEMVKFRVEMLTHERCRKVNDVQKLQKTRDAIYEKNQDRGTELMNNYQSLHKEMERLKEKQKTYIDAREAYLVTSSQLAFRQRQLISKLNQIYPVTQAANGKFAICGVHLPNSEDFSGNDDIMIAVSLGYVAHVTQMISVFLQVPLRYPIIHSGSGSKVIDHVVEKIPEKDRQFPLFSRGKDKLQFHYGVYLLNKNVSQLRWFCGLQTQDLRATLPNLSGLLRLQPSCDIMDHRTSSGSSLDLRSSSQNQSPVGSIQAEFKKHPNGHKREARIFEKCHRVSRSMGSSEIQIQIKGTSSAETVKDSLVSSAPAVTTSLSYSLDKGLNEYEELKKAQGAVKLPPALQQPPLSHVGSEPILTTDLREKIAPDEADTVSSGDEAKKHFLQSWQAGGPAPMCSDDDLEASSQDARQPDTVAEETDQGEGEAGGETDTATVTATDSGQAAQVSAEAVEDLQESEKEQPVPEPAEFNQSHQSSQEQQNVISPDSNVENNHTSVSCQSSLSSETDSLLDGGDRTLLQDVDDRTSPADSNITQKTVSSVVDSVNCNEDKLETRNNVLESKRGSKLDGFDENVSLQEINSLIDNSALVDTMFASVASRTEALANRSGSFNLVRSRHSSTLEDGT